MTRARARRTAKPARAPRRGNAAGLRERIAGIRARRAGAISTKEAIAVVDGVLAAGRRMSARGRRLRSEIRRLSEFIHTLRSDIVLVRTDEVKKEFIPTATDELDAIIEATAEATNAIMDAVEMVERTGGALAGEHASRLTEATTKIYEACGFQDITGQRITKVIKALKEIEQRVDAMVAAFGEEAVARPAQAGKPAKPKADGDKKPIADEDLLHGPQLKSAAKTQDEIDALLFGPGR
jgi:chemotaxis protein CheZ